MARRPNKIIPITKNEMIHRISAETGFTLVNSKIAYDAVIKVIMDVLEDGRTIIFQGFGRLEPFVKAPRNYYQLECGKGYKTDEKGKRVVIKMPETKNIRFHIANRFKYELNPGVFIGETMYMDDCM